MDSFIDKRRFNFKYFSTRLSALSDFIELAKPTPGSDPSWFGFPITLKENAGVKRLDLVRYLDQFKIGSRLLFAGNLTNQPYFEGVEYRISGELKNTDLVMNNDINRF